MHGLKLVLSCLVYIHSSCLIHSLQYASSYVEVFIKNVSPLFSSYAISFSLTYISYYVRLLVRLSKLVLTVNTLRLCRRIFEVVVLPCIYFLHQFETPKYGINLK